MNTPKFSTSWSPYQAYAALDVLEELRQMIWDAYESELVEIIIHENHELSDQQQAEHAELHDPDTGDEIPF